VERASLARPNLWEPWSGPRLRARGEQRSNEWLVASVDRALSIRTGDARHRAQTAMGLLHGFFPSSSRARQTRQCSWVPSESASQTRQRSRVSHHAHCRMSFIFHAVCTTVSAYRSASKVATLEKLSGNSNGTKSACIAAPKDRKHRLNKFTSTE
jgi:hypothetical protein